MKDVNWTIAKMKFDRYNLKYQFEPSSNTLTLGGINTIKYQLLYVALPALLGLTIIGLEMTGLFSNASNVKMWVIGLVMILASIYGLISVKKMTESNRAQKIISPNKVVFSEGEHLEFQKEKITKIDLKIINSEKQEFHGEIIMSIDNQEITLLRILGDDSRLLRDDLEYLSEFISKIVFSQ